MNDTDARLWHPWLRINRVLRAMLHERWSAEAWPQVRTEFTKALTLRSQIRRRGVVQLTNWRDVGRGGATMTGRRRVVGIVGVVAVLAMACTSLPPTKPITDGKVLVGTWKGPLSTRGGSHDYTFTIRDDGTYVGVSPTLNPSTTDGTWRVVDGKAVWKSNTTGRMGTLILHEGEGRQVLRLLSDDGISEADRCKTPRAVGALRRGRVCTLPTCDLAYGARSRRVGGDGEEAGPSPADSRRTGQENRRARIGGRTMAHAR